MISLAARSLDPEILDGALAEESLVVDEYATTLRQIELINRLTFGYAPTLAALDEVLRLYPDVKSLRVLDVGSGHGDTLRAIRAWGRRRRVDLELTGLDLNPKAARLAAASAREAQTRDEDGIRFISGNVFDENGPHAGGEYDVILSALFTHHLDDGQIARFLRWQTERARLAWFVNDLHRHPVAYHFIRLATRIARFNRLIRNDAPLSVARAFTAADWRVLARAGGVPEASLRMRWHPSFRIGVFCDTRSARGET